MKSNGDLPNCSDFLKYAQPVTILSRFGGREEQAEGEAEEYSSYQEKLAHFLSEEVELYGQHGLTQSPYDFFYELIQDFDREYVDDEEC